MTGAPTTATFTATILGTVNAKVVQSEDFDPTSIASLLNSFQRLEGTAQLGIIMGFNETNRVLTYIVDGVKQTTEVGNAGSLTTGGATP
jgi:hypothetical protein